MKEMHSWFRGRMSFIGGFVAASLLFGGLAGAAEIMQKDIRVSFLPLTYIFDGQQKDPPTDQMGFTYNGRTYVPLRFMAEAMGKKVDWDGNTYTIYMGRRPSPLPAEWTDYRTDGPSPGKIEFFPSGAVAVHGEAMANALLFSAFALTPKEPGSMASTTIIKEFTPAPTAKSVSGTVFVPSHYFGTKPNRMVGELTILNALNQAIYQSPALTAGSDPVAFDIPVMSPRLRVAITLYQDQGVPVTDTLMQAQIGLSNFQFK